MIDSHKQTTGRVDRTSFSSIKESDDGVAQSFTTTKTSSYLRAEDEEAISDGLVTPPMERPGLMTNPHSALHGFVCPCDGFRGWKAIGIRGKVASKSFGDLRALGNRFDWDVKKDVGMPSVAKEEDGRYAAGQSPLEMLPMELLGESISIFMIQFWTNLWGYFFQCGYSKSPHVNLIT
jgi:hypothetical protein